jgi:hypothetical protein
LVNFLSFIKFVPDVIRAYLSEKQHKRELLWDFVLDAVGLEECLSPDSHEPGTVSFATIDLRMRLLQQGQPERANKCGVPTVDDVTREVKIKDILREMVGAGKLQRCRQTDRWKILSGEPRKAWHVEVKARVGVEPTNSGSAEHRLDRFFKCGILKLLAVWRNWQTQQTQNLPEPSSVKVRFLSPPPKFLLVSTWALAWVQWYEQNIGVTQFASRKSLDRWNS